METGVQLVIYRRNSIYDHLIIKENVTSVDTKNYQKSHETRTRLNLNAHGINSYLVSAYVYWLKRSNCYRQAALKALLDFSESKAVSDRSPMIYIRLRTPRHQYLSYKWNERVTQMVLERRELDHAMSWLSTLGGAFSALGDTFEHCAEMAGKISIRQLQLALRIGDPLLVARCKLWAALSLLQRGWLKVTKNIVISCYQLAVVEKDVRLQNMCRGIWSKLQYTYKLKRQSKKL
ncbi:uncharacterized protein F58A4.6 [Athalia rosae]|uniref:uncharacterized protein F58A4.6 n=1 Tax=Athalia rosae TaxID=37344 RepID=UPI0020335DE4|nr:uncharacterized protein F58A4.6 [Athalia rosae]